MRVARWILAVPVMLLLLVGHGTSAQETAPDIPDTGVYVTTQDFSSLRAGPGKNWERLAVVPPVTTLPAVGRSAATDWIQVVYDGQTGWIYYTLLVWSGRIFDLPVDGVNPEPFARGFEVEAYTIRETPLYARGVSPDDQVGTLPEDTQVEVTARLGDPGGYIQLQVRHEGNLYWVGSWNLRVEDGLLRNVLDLSYRYAFGRLLSDFERDINEGSNRLNRIADQWTTIDAGGSVNCDRIPSRLSPRRVSDADVNSEPVFRPAADALDDAIGHVNTAIAALDDACNRDTLFLTRQEVNQALNEVDAARRNYNLTQSLLRSLQRRDPLRG